MSEKRFSWKTEKLQHSDDEVLLVVDNANKDWKGHILNIVDLLNSLAEENEQLKAYKLYEDNKRLQTILADLKEENDQLKVANAKWVDKSLQDKQILYSNANCKELTQKYLQLKEENEQLKQEIKQYWKCRDKWKQEAKELKEENEQLKEELNNLKKDETMLYYYTLTRYGGDGV